MTIKTSTLRPGLLVVLKTSVTGTVSYFKTVLESEKLSEEGVQTAKWETERTVKDPVEYEAAKKARSKARSLLTGVCVNSTFGLMCPETAVERLEGAIAAARKVADEFNSGAKAARVNVYIITGRIAPDDVEAMRAINSEVVELLQEMESGVKALDVKTIREAAGRAKAVGVMLSPEMNAKVQLAVEAARAEASKIVSAEGEGQKKDVDLWTLRTIGEQRAAFLDFGDAGEVAAPQSEGRAIDLFPGEKPDLVAAASTMGA